MKVLFIGGTGTISTAISRLLLRQGDELYLLNRGQRNKVFENAPALHEINCDINDVAAVRQKLDGLSFDVAADFIAYRPEHVERDYELLRGRCKQYIFISSASAYQKPPTEYIVSEAVPLANPLWQYSRDKAACEDFLFEKYRSEGFPVTVVRPSHTYDERSVPIGAHGANGSYSVLKRIADGKPVIIHGDGTSLWTMTHSSDFARGFAGLLGNIHALGSAVQIMSEETVTWNQIYRVIADAIAELAESTGAVAKPFKAVHVASEFLAKVGVKEGVYNYDFQGSLVGDKANSAVFDTSRLRRMVPDFCAKVRVDQGIKDTVKYVMTHKECPREDPQFDAWCDRVIAELDAEAESLLRD